MTRRSMLGQRVVIRSLAGISYAGIVRAIRADSGQGELFELASDVDDVYQRFVHVVDRAAQIQVFGRRGEAGGTR